MSKVREPHWSSRVFMRLYQGVRIMVQSNEEHVRQRAHQLWEQAGSPEGREDEFWFEAERELQNGDPALNAEEEAPKFTE
jgi:hypothetical protein